MPRRIDRFGELVGEALKGNTFKEAARLTGLSYTALANWASGEIPTSPDFIRSIADGLGYPRSPLLDAAEFKVTAEDWQRDLEHFPEQSAAYEREIAGRHVELSPAEAALLAAFKGGARLLGRIDEPVIEGTAGARHGWRVDEAERRPLKDALGGDIFVCITGDSMPPFEEGDVVGVSTREARPGNGVIVTIEGDSFCKELEAIHERDGEVYYTLKSRNGSYESREVRAVDVTIHGVVVSHTKPWPH